MKPADEELELTRLLAEEGSPLGASVTALRERGPDASELASLASRLSLRGVDVTEPPPAAVKEPQLWKKWALLGGGGALAGALWLALRAPAPPVVVPTDTAERARALETGRAERAVRPAPGQRPAPALASDARKDAAMPSAPAADAAPAPAAAEPVAGAARLAVSAPPERPSAAVEAAPRSPAQERAKPSSERPASALPPQAPLASESGPEGEGALPSEIELLRDARLSLRQSPAAALAFTEQHARLYPQGKLTQERELIAISALVATGRRTAALSRGARFEQSFPTSPYRKQVSELLK